MKPKTPTRNELQSALDDLLATSVKPETPPAGWKTTMDWAKECGKSRPTIQKKMAELVEAGTWEMRRFTIKSGQKIGPVPHYRKIP